MSHILDIACIFMAGMNAACVLYSVRDGRPWAFSLLAAVANVLVGLNLGLNP